MRKLSVESLMHAAAEVAAVAGRSALRRFGRAIDVESKADGSPVTIADREAEQAARAWIAARFPKDAVLGEEFGAQGAAPGRRWIVDPIDGTKAFVAGVPLWGSIVAVEQDGEVVASALAFPAIGEGLVAGRGLGAWSGGGRAHVSAVADLAAARVLATDVTFGRDHGRRDRWVALVARAGVGRTWGDAYGYLLVATGRAEVMVDPRLAPWDVAPVGIAIEEAGGVFTNWNGERDLLADGGIATNAALAGEVRSLLVPPGA